MGDVVGDFIEGVAHGQLGGKLGDREARGLGSQGGTARHPGVHFNHNHIAGLRVHRKLDVGAAGFHPNFADDLDRGIP